MTSKQYRKKAWEVLRKDYWILFVANIIVIAAVAVTNVFSIIIAGPLLVGLNLLHVNTARGKNADIADVVSPFTDRYINALSASVLKTVFIVLWSFLFIIPGLIKSYSYAMVEYIIAFDDNIGGTEAITKSRELMNGNKGRLFLLHLSFIGWALLTIPTLGIGAFFLAPYIKAAEAEFYLDLIGGKKEESSHFVDEDDFTIEFK